MKHIIYISSILIIFLFSCNDSEKQDYENNIQNDSLTPASEIGQEKSNPNQLIIEGEDIWIRNKPFDGDVVLKLNSGNKCKVIEKGELVQLRDMKDRWYKIEFEGKTGWVFGSQTNLKTGETVKIMDFKVYLTEFIEAFNNEEADLATFAHVDIGSSFLYNPGAYCTGGDPKYVPRKLNNPIPVNNSFDIKPQGDFCEGYPGVKTGFYFYRITEKDLPRYVKDFDDEGGTIIGTINIPDQYKHNEFKEVTVVTDEYHYAYLYFVFIEDMWHLICQNFCDCSA